MTVTETRTMPDEKNNSLMRNLGQFVGHIVKGLKSRPGEPQRTVVRREVEEEDHGDMVLRRTTIEEVELRKKSDEGQGTEEAEV